MSLHDDFTADPRPVEWRWIFRGGHLYPASECTNLVESERASIAADPSPGAAQVDACVGPHLPMSLEVTLD